MYVTFRIFILFGLSFFNVSVLAQWQQFNYVAMTTPISLVFWEEDAFRSRTIAEEVFKEFDAIEQQMSRYIFESELSYINRLAATEDVKVSASLFEVLSAAMSISALSEGAFDVTFGSVGFLYDFRKRVEPEFAEIEAKKKLLNYRHVNLDASKRTVKFAEEGVMLDLGGIAKGYAVDKGLEILNFHGIRSAHLSAGGDMRLLGDKRGAPWVIGIQNPRDKAKKAVVLPLSDVAVSTSGDYERYFINDAGERVHHILSPQTGKPVQGLQSVTVLAKNALTSDGLSTAVFVLGLKKGLELVNRLEGVDAIIIDKHGKVHYSNDLMPPNSGR